MSYTAQSFGMASRFTVRVSALGFSSRAITAPPGSTSFLPAFFISSRARSIRSGSTSDLPVSSPMASKKVQAIAPPSRICVHLRQQRLDQVDLAADLGPAEHGDERPLRLVQRLTQVAELPLHEKAGDRRLQDPGDGFGARVGPVGRAERIVHVEVAQRGELLGQSGVVLFLTGIEAGVLRYRHPAARQPLG